MSSANDQHNAKVDEALRLALQQTPGLHPDGQAILREDFRLQVEYPNEYVAFIDSWKTQKNGRQFVRRIIAHAKSLPPIHKAIAALSPKDQKRVVLRFASDPYPEVLDVR